MTGKTFQNIRAFIEQKSFALMKHESKPYIKAGFDKSKYHEIEVGNRHFVVIATNTFYHILTSVLVDACENFPDLFGNDDVNGVLEALYNVEKVNEFERFSDFLKEEQFAWILEIVNEGINPKILRVDLFRKVELNREDQSKTEFTGGLFHVFKHFNYKGIPLSTKSEKNDIEHPTSIIGYLINGFYFADLTFTSDYKCYSISKLNDKYNLRFDFYYGRETGVYFVNSIRKE